MSSQLNMPMLQSITNSDRPRTADGISPSRPKRPVASRNVSFNTAGLDDDGAYPTLEPLQWKKQDKWQRVNRHVQNVDSHIAPTTPSPARPSITPFVAYDDSFAALLGPNPAIKLLITDPRAPFFYSGGAWIPRTSTLFLTSNLLRDHDPSSASSADKRTEVSKVEFYSPTDFSRDKVRSPDRNYLAAGCAPHPLPESPGIVLCAQGTLKDPAGLVFVDLKRPHKSHMLLNNFQGRPFNSPCDIATNFLDNCLYFTDPAYGYERGYRQKPELPAAHIYRFDPSTGDCRVVADGLSRPGGLTFSPDYTILYVSDLGDKYGGTAIHAFDLKYNASASAHPGPLALSISTTSPLRSGTSSRHQKSASASSTDSFGDSATLPYRASPTASPHALAVANRLTSQPSTTTNGHSNRGGLSRSNSRDRARKVLDIAQNQSRQLKSMSSNLGMNLKSSFNTTPSLSQTIIQHQQQHHPNHQHPPVQPPGILSPSLTASSSYLSSTFNPTTDGPVRLSSFLTNKRLFAYTASRAPSGGISTDPIQGNVWLGTDQGVEVFSGCMGSMMGKVLVPENEDECPTDKRRDGGKKMTGVSRVAFGSEPGEAWLLGGERLWRIGFGGVGGAMS